MTKPLGKLKLLELAEFQNLPTEFSQRISHVRER